MVSPLLKTKNKQNLTIDKSIIDLFKVIYLEQNKAKDKKGESQNIVVSDLISKMAFYYEKIRNSVDYNEEYLLRKNAIERILKRQIIIEGIVKTSKSEKISKHLLFELIRAGYLANGKIPESKIEEIGKIIEKYIKLRNNILPKIEYSLQSIKKNTKNRKTFEERNDFNNWIISVLAGDIESSLGIDDVKNVIVRNLYQYLSKNIQLPSDSKYFNDLEIQIYIGIYRNFLKFDDGMFKFILFKYYNEGWDNPSDDDIEKIAKNINQIQDMIDYQINHPLAKQMDKIISRYNVYFTILVSMIRKDPGYVYDVAKNKSHLFPDLIKKAFNEKYKERRSKLKRAGVRSIIYIFLTKSVFATLIEVPATRWLGEKIDFFSLGINILFPPFLLFLAVFFTQLSSSKNLQAIVDGVEEITFKEKRKKEKILFKKPTKRSFAKSFIFNTLYSITFLCSFGFVVWGLNKIHFSIVSIIIFLFFLTLVSFFAIRIRKTTKEFIIVRPRENIFTFLLDFFSIPMISVGKWLSNKFSKINVFIFLMDFIIETPFKIFVQIAEDWTGYVKERKDEIV